MLDLSPDQTSFSTNKGSWIWDLYGLDITVVNSTVDPRFSFMTVDHDGKVRMDCSSPYAMARLVGLRDRFEISFGNDTDADRHGIVTRSMGLMNPNHYLADQHGGRFLGQCIHPCAHPHGYLEAQEGGPGRVGLE